ncbi:MAG: phage shock protein E [Cyclobacteriaceae bacterium]|jgi:phage shock protein E
MSFLSKLFSNNQKPIDQLLEEGAVIIDVRSTAEFKSGHLKRSVNIPLDQLLDKLGKLDMSKPVITCCASGMRSGSAKRILKSKGFAEVVNGGGWSSLQKYDK